jgi:dihydroorotate dehydrogenase
VIPSSGRRLPFGSVYDPQGDSVMDVYRGLLRPLLFQLSAEQAHGLAAFALRQPGPWRLIGATPRDPRLETQVGGLRLANPVGLAAGFDKNLRFLDALGALGFGYVVGGSVTAEARTGNPRPRIGRYTDRQSLVNAMGLPNRGAAAARRSMEGLLRTAPYLVSVWGEREDEVWAAFDAVAPLADGIELNISCPNVHSGRDRDAEALLRAVLPRMRRALRKPLFVKMPPYTGEVEREAVLRLVRIAQDQGVDGITASNTFPIQSREMSIGTGGLSGRAVFPDTVRIVRDIYQVTEGRLAINACGGIFTAIDTIRCIRAGASTVQVYTGFIYQGPRIVRDITLGLLQELAAYPAGVSGLVGAGT